MLSIVTNIHKNILSAQCSIKCNPQNSRISNIKVTCTKTHLSVNVFNDSELLHSIKILTPENFFIPSSVLKKDSLHEKIELINDTLTISRSCPELKIANHTLQINYPLNESTHNSEENICGPDCKERVDFTDIYNNSSSIIEENKLTSKSKENISNPSSEAHVDFSVVENNSSSITDKNGKKRRKEENISEPSCEEHVDKENASSPNCEEHIGEIEDKSYLPAENSVEINFRIQISNGDLIAACSSESPSVPSFLDFFKTQIQVNEPYLVCCTHCGTQLSDTLVTFEDLEKFDGMVENLSEEYFCHGHRSHRLPDGVYFKKRLYVDVEGMYIHRVISESFLTEEVCKITTSPPEGGYSGLVDYFAKNSEQYSLTHKYEYDLRKKFNYNHRCKVCFTVLTIKETKEDFCLFYPEAIMFKKPNSQLCSRDGYLQKFVMLSLWTIICKGYCKLTGRRAVSKIIFECCCTGSGSVEAILMFIPPTKVAQFSLQSTLLALPTEVRFTTSDVFKVMFHIATFPSPHVYIWRRDFYTECYKVGSSFFSTLKTILLSSVEIMRVDTELHGDFMTGCLSFKNLDL